MAYQANDYAHLLGKIDGISDTTLQNHFKLYQGYVTNTNTLLEVQERLQTEGKLASPEFAEVTRRFGFEFNGMRLHEYYFENLGAGGGMLDGNTALGRKITEQFGSIDKCWSDFMGKGKIRGIGWVVMYYDSKADCLLNVWINEHQTNHLAGERPILVMDVWEHAYFTDYQTERPKYLEAFAKNINWGEVARRFEWAAGTMRKAA